MIEVEFEMLAPRWRRFAAAVIDIAVVGVLVAATLFAMAKLSLDETQGNELAIVVVLVLYEVGLTVASGGRSLGRAALRIRLVRESDLSAPSLVQCAARLLTRVLLFSGFVVFVSYEPDLIGVAMLLGLELVVASVTPRRQSVADLVSRTVVAIQSHAQSNAV